MLITIPFPQFLAACRLHGRNIEVETKVDGRSRTTKFSLLTPREQLVAARVWYDAGQKPKGLELYDENHEERSRVSEARSDFNRTS